MDEDPTEHKEQSDKGTERRAGEGLEGEGSVEAVTPKLEMWLQQIPGNTSDIWVQKGTSRKPKPSVKIHTIVNTKNKYEATEQILNRVMDTQTVELIRTECGDCDVLLLFCVVITRPGSDVEEALMNIPDAAKPTPVILVMMYHTRDVNYLSDAFQWSTEYPEVKTHVDFLFHQTKNGLLECDKNNKAIQKLRDSVTEYTVKKI